VVYVLLKLSFKKLELFVDAVLALGVVHRAGGVSTVKESRVANIKELPIPIDPTGVRTCFYWNYKPMQKLDQKL